MTSSVSCSDSDKEWFNDFQQDDENQAEAFSRLVDQAKAFQGEPVDVEQLADELDPKLGASMHLAAYRGCKEYFEGNDP